MDADDVLDIIASIATTDPRLFTLSSLPTGAWVASSRIWPDISVRAQSPDDALFALESSLSSHLSNTLAGGIEVDLPNPERR